MIEDGTLVYEKESYVLDWFRNFLNNASTSFQASAFCFNKYYEKCVNTLVNLPYNNTLKSEISEESLNSIYADDLMDFKENCGYNRVLTHLKNDPYFLNEAVVRGLISDEVARVILALPSSKIGKMTKEEVNLLISNSREYLFNVQNGTVAQLQQSISASSEEIDKNLVSLLKLQRLDNLQVKYAHTARIVYLTDLEVRKLGVSDELVKSILYTSALFHDVGRFYQGTYYNSYFEGALKKTENNSIKDHAEAGYYYSLLDMINLNVLGAATNEDLIIHSIASAVVKKHQLPNSSLGNYDKMISDFQFSDDVKQRMLDFVLACYGKSSKFDGGLHSKFQQTVPGNAEAMRQGFTDSMLNIISAYTGEKDLDGVRDAVYGLFSYEMPSLVLDEEKIAILRQNLTGNDLIELERKVSNNETVVLSPLYNKVIKDYTINKLLGDNSSNSQVVRDFMDNLINSSDVADYYSQYDIVATIDKVMEYAAKGEKYQGIELDADIAKVLRMSMGLVMDMDKLDILVQRAIKRYPDWKPDMIRIKSLTADIDKGITEDESLLDILEDQFQITVKRDESGRIVVDEVLADVIRHTVNVNETFKTKFGDDYDFSQIVEGYLLDERAEGALKDSLGGKVVSMPYEIMAKAHPDLMERYQIEMDLVLPPDLRENIFKIDEDRVYKQGANGAVTAFPLGSNASSQEHFWWGNAFPGVWWQLDQFIMTNMRSMESLRFVKDTGLLERIGEAYKSEECPKEFGMFVDEIIGFSSDFIDLALTAKINNGGDIIFSEEDKTGYNPVILSDKEVMLKIRNEAAIRYQAKKVQNSISQETDINEDSMELDRMFSDQETPVVKDSFGNDLNSMMADYRKATSLIGGGINQDSKK